MKLKMLVSMAGADFSLSPGQETDRFSGAEAQRFIDTGIAVPVNDEKQERAARRPAPEKRD